jgi:catechol 2,3-dioxygenase-like lactoylglutathione lyase family enzyme
MRLRLHHTDLFAADLDAALRWWSDNLDARVRHDVIFAGARNVFVSVGDGRLHFYDQAPPGPRSGAVHHLGVQTDDLDGLVRRMAANGVVFAKPLTEGPDARYVMVEAPDGVLLELFAPRADRVPPVLRDYFDWPLAASPA